MWGTHPVLSECVANISGRAELLAFFFGFSGMALGIGYAGRRSPVVICTYAAVCEILAVLSKESAVVFPLLFLILSYVQRSSHESATVRRYTLAGLCGGVLVALGLRYAALGHIFPQAAVIGFLDNPLAHVPSSLRILSALVMLGRYLAICLLPFPLSADYSFPHLTPLTVPPSMTACAYGILLLLLLCLLLRADMLKNIKTQGGCIWFLCAFALTANVVFPIGTIFGERLLYVPLVGLIVATLSIGEELLGPAITKAVCSGLVPLLGLATMAHIPVWESQKTLWSHQILVTPDSAKTQQNYATVALNQGQPTEALQHASLAIDTYPPYEHAYVIKSYALAQLGKMGDAEKAARRSIELNEYFEDGYDALARILFHQGRYDEARRVIKQGLNLNPRNPRLLEDQYVLDNLVQHQS
jgi:tetratricopeptide (TPR) repeat protein